MKYHYIILLSFLFLFTKIQCQEYVWIGANSNTIDKDSFLSKWGNRTNILSRWDSIGVDKKRYATLKKDLYQIGNIEFNTIIKQLESITGQKYFTDKTLIIHYTFKDDLCGSTSNKWRKTNITNEKKWLEPFIKIFSEKNAFYIRLFEKGISLKLKTDIKNEYFFIDKNNFFREKIFKNPTLCGSVSVIKPNNQVLLRNGEGSIKHVIKHIDSKEWKIFFKTN